jgi:hypothetical protein
VKLGLETDVVPNQPGIGLKRLSVIVGNSPLPSLKIVNPEAMADGHCPGKAKPARGQIQYGIMNLSVVMRGL